MHRRTILTAVTAGAAIAACRSSKPPLPLNNPQIHWRMVTSWPQSLDIIMGTLRWMTQRIEAMTEGRFVIEIFAADEVVPALKVMDAVSDSTVECGHTASYYYLGKELALAFATTLPFGLTAVQHNAWLYHQGGLEMIRALYEPFNLINFPAGNTGGQMGGWYKRPIESLADLKGLKMRIPGLGGEIMSRLGVNVQVIPGGELFLALQRGALDAADWIGPHDDAKLGLSNAAQYYYAPGWWEPGAGFDALVNKKAWNTLPSNYQAIFEGVAMEANLRMLTQFNQANQVAIAQLQQQGTQVLSYSNDILQRAESIALDLYEEKALQNQKFRKIYAPWKQFRDQANQWQQLNELKYTQFMAR